MHVNVGLNLAMAASSPVAASLDSNLGSHHVAMSVDLHRGDGTPVPLHVICSPLNDKQLACSEELHARMVGASCRKRLLQFPSRHGG